MVPIIHIQDMVNGAPAVFQTPKEHVATKALLANFPAASPLLSCHDRQALIWELVNWVPDADRQSIMLMLDLHT